MHKFIQGIYQTQLSLQRYKRKNKNKWTRKFARISV